MYTTQSDVTKYQFATWNSWNEFGTNCCCRPKVVNSYDFELWKCLSSSSSSQSGPNNFIYKVDLILKLIILYRI